MSIPPNEYLNNEEAMVVDWRKRRRLLKNYRGQGPML
jgi:hypothetical protein